MKKLPTARALPLVLVSFALALPVEAQGSDSCTTPTAISGEGVFAFDSTAATTGSQGQSNCGTFGAVHRDIWFVWTAPEDGQASLSLCGTASFDTEVLAYSGAGCPGGNALACNDDACGLQSQIGWEVASGTTYTIQLGSYPGSAGGVGTFTIEVGPPPPPCGPNTGPDVIVGDLSDVLNAAAFNGFDAIALGTVSCNLGSGPLNWIASTNDHPVIRQNLYRYKVVDGAGRFEQVGLSWLKHGFASLQGSLCCPCQPGGDGQHLGVGCSDPYDSGLNGSQGGLGPNWQVNAHTGFFTYPPADPTHANDPVYRRCQVPLTDLETTSGSTTRFFGEGHYVTKDDATAGNQNNNASYREMTCSGGPSNFSLQLAGITQRTLPAIRAWAVVDPQVNLVDLQIPGEGLVILGTRATDIGSGTWRYEYAVYNMNSDRNVGSFSVPIPAGVTVTNPSFHDVHYHDGDGPGDVNFSGASWSSSEAGNAITWACETEIQNPSANAIRWGTLYNFRFDANAPPVDGTITLGLWKGGSPPAVSATGDVPGGDGAIASFCFGDGSGLACPCGNNGAAFRGCENSASTGGAQLSATGNPSLASDTLVMTSAGERPTAFSLFIQGDAEIPPVLFGDAVRCAGGNLKRLYSKNAVAGAVSAPTGAELAVSARSAALGDPIPPMGTRFYQVYYRDPDPSFCPDPPGSTFNVSSGLRIVWSP